jgi:hypothetical protein
MTGLPAIPTEARQCPDCAADELLFCRPHLHALFTSRERGLLGNMRGDRRRIAEGLAPLLPPTPAKPRSRHVCRKHPEQPVTFKGVGCHNCFTAANPLKGNHDDRN